MQRAVTIGVTALTVGIAANGTVQAGLFDLVRKAAGGDRYVAQADPPLPAPGVSNRVTPASQAAADEQPPVPIPDGAAPNAATPSAPAAAAPIELYPCVTYKDRDEMHPCAVPVIVCVPDPSSVKHPFYWLVGDAPHDPCCDPCVPCARPMAYVQICVPPDCPVPEPRVHHHDREYTYDFGAYSVDVRLHRGEIVVDYED
jgi:hypothetical protein